MISFRRYRHVLRLFAGSVLLLLLVFHSNRWTDKPKPELQETQIKYPLAWKHIHLSAGLGGAWYIPPTWLPKHSLPPANLLEAAWLASEIVNKKPTRYLENTAIPRIVHQTWKSTDTKHFPGKALDGIEKWLGYATALESNMAYFMWDDSGVRELLRTIDSSYLRAANAKSPKSVELADLLPRSVEVADIFRVAVCNTIGGVYADIDTIPLRSPTTWISSADISNWTDPLTTLTYGAHGTSNTSYPPPQPTTPVSLILGIEADNEESTSTHWRMGYHFPVQLTQWSLASRAKQSVLDRFLEDFWSKMMGILEAEREGNSSVVELGKQDPLELTGPVAMTRATRDYLEGKTGLRWQSMSGIEDGGRSKVVLDTLILPITGFSPGRGHYGNMGSKPLTHEDARVQHYAQGSWRSFHMKVEMGKLCRTLFGMCKDWSKV